MPAFWLELLGSKATYGRLWKRQAWKGSNQEFYFGEVGLC